MNQAQTKQSKQAVAKSNRRKLVWGLICLIGPTVLIILSFLAPTIINLEASPAAMNNSEYQNRGMTDPSTAPSRLSVGAELSERMPAAAENVYYPISKGRQIANLVISIVFVIAIIAWLPGILIGIVLLTKRKPIPPATSKGIKPNKLP